jgi:hypothetical protein
MAPALKKRKIAAGTTGPSSKIIPSIASFGRISKAGNSQQSGIKGVKSHKDLSNVSCWDSSGGIQIVTKKRKLVEQETPPKKEEDNSPATVKSSPQLRTVPRKTLPPRAKCAETPTKGTRAFLAAFSLSSSPLSVKSSPPSTLRNTPPTSPATVKSLSTTHTPSASLPDELQDLINLHSAFMKALSLHYAHNGSFAPVDLRILRPSLERTWGKRRISTEDIQRIVGILSLPTSPIDQNNIPIPINLSDYSSGKICIELATSPTRNSSGFNFQPLDADGLNARFASNIRELWRRQDGRRNPTSYLSDLPLAEITNCKSVAKTAPLLAKGQLRLTDLKAGAIRAQSSSVTTKAIISTSTTTGQVKPASLRQSTLLERIKAKEAHQSTLPSAPSLETIARRSALQRLEEVVPVLELLTTSQIQSKNVKLDGGLDGGDGDRIFSFTMPTVIQHLQMSLRNPISKDEAVFCMGLLAEEIAPGWVGLRDIGKVKGVTVRRKGLGTREIGERIRVALGK